MNRQHLTNSDTSGQAYESILPQHNPLRPEYPVETNFYQISPWTIQMTRWHWHEEFEILLVADGTVLVKLEGPGAYSFQRRRCYIKSKSSARNPIHRHR